MDRIKENIKIQQGIDKFNIEKSVIGTEAYYINQDIQKGLSGDEIIEKARSGVYKLTAENKKMGRVGQKYGESRKEDDKQNDDFKHKDEYAYGEARSLEEFKKLDYKPEHLLVNKNSNKIVAAYSSMNVPNYSKYSGPNNNTGYKIISTSTAKNPQPYLDQKPIDYEDSKNWESSSKESTEKKEETVGSGDYKTKKSNLPENFSDVKSILMAKTWLENKYGKDFKGSQLTDKEIDIYQDIKQKEKSGFYNYK